MGFLFYNMNELKYTTHTFQMLADTHTPVGIYLKLRDVFHQTLLLESSDYHAAENRSYLENLPDHALGFITSNN